MEKIVIATGNKHKVEEYKAFFEGAEVLSLKDIGFTDDIEETGETFFDNAFIKAKAVSDFLAEFGDDAAVIADDSGLCIEALDGEPGVRSARYASDHNKELNRKAVLEKMKGKKNRKAYFICVLVKLYPNGEYISAEGRTYGTILTKVAKNADQAFAYDSIFKSDDLGKPFSESTIEEKNSVSHRIRAMKRLFEIEEEMKSI